MHMCTLSSCAFNFPLIDHRLVIFVMASRSVSESDQELPGPSKWKSTAARTESSSRKWFHSAGLYKTKFQASWQKTWLFMSPVKGNHHAFYCTVCLETVFCGHQGEQDVSRHIEIPKEYQNYEEHQMAVDGSSDTGLSKINPMIVRLCDTDSGRVTTQLLTSGMLILIVHVHMLATL